MAHDNPHGVHTPASSEEKHATPESLDSEQAVSSSPGTRWAGIVAVLFNVVIGLLVAAPFLLIGAVLLGSWFDTLSVPHVHTELKKLPGVVSVTEAETRAGDLTFRDNAFFTVLADADLSASAQDDLAGQIAGILATSQRSTRIMVELDLGDFSVGISPVAELNADRLVSARALANIDGIVRATVLWDVAGDDLIFDESNEGLMVWVQARTRTPTELIDRVLPLLNTADGPTVTAIILGENPYHERLYSWNTPVGGHEGEQTDSINTEFSVPFDDGVL